MTNRIIELKCTASVKLDNYQFVVSFNSADNEKYQITLKENVRIGTIIRINSCYHTLQKFDNDFRISIKQDYFIKKVPEILELFLAEKYETKDKKQISVYKDSNTLEVFKMAEKESRLKLNSTRLINLKKEKLVIYKEAHIFNGNYIIENWIHQFENK